MIKKIFIGLALAVVLCGVAIAYMVHSNNERVRLENIENNHHILVNNIIRSNHVDADAINEMRTEIADIPELKQYDEALQKYLEIAAAEAEGANACPVTISVNAKGPKGEGLWDASVNITNNSDKEIKFVDFEIVGTTAAGETISCKNKTKCRWSEMKPSETAKTGIWTLSLEKDMNKDAFSVRDIYIEFADGSLWPGNPECITNLETLKSAFNDGMKTLL